MSSTEVAGMSKARRIRLVLGESFTETGALYHRSIQDDALKRKIHLIVAKTLGGLRQESTLHDYQYPDGPAHFVLGRLLGKGGFSSVHNVVLDDTKDKDGDSVDMVCKFLSDSTIANPDKLPAAAADIVREAYFLSTLQHPHIISLRGVGPLDDISQYFLLLDKIRVPLAKKVEEEWKGVVARTDVAGGHLVLGTRLDYAVQIANAMVFLHAHKIIYRDLKIDNIGLNSDGAILLYDFGLAREVKKETPSENGLYQLTGNTGSPNTMAPEVRKRHRYNHKADMYSFAIVLWELLHARYAAVPQNPNDRPRLELGFFPSAIEDLIRQGWHWNPHSRPEFATMEHDLNTLLDEIVPHHQRRHKRNKHSNKNKRDKSPLRNFFGALGFGGGGKS